jgi:hypothetical protein
MRSIVWLASYPKSGNTWARLMITALRKTDHAALDINEIAGQVNIASARATFDHRLLLDSGLLTHDEIDALRPRVYEDIAAEEDPDDEEDDRGAAVHFVKVHDAYATLPGGEPLLGGARGAKGAILVVRDPRAVVPSLANHLHMGIDEAIAFMANPAAGFCASDKLLPPQLRQLLFGWSGHAASWLEQRDIPVHLLRYEDLKRDTEAMFAQAMAFADVPAAPQDIARAAAMTRFETLQAQEKAAGFKEWNARQSGGALFFRRGEAAGWRDELSADQVRRIEDAHGPMMTRLGYAPEAR